MEDFSKIIGDSDFSCLFISKEVKHQLTHQTIYSKFWHLNIPTFKNKTFSKVYWDDFSNFLNISQTL